MRVQAYITSGILEKYVLGMTTEEETQEIMDQASQHLEVKEEIAQIRKTMRGYILSHQIAPPENLKEKVLGLTSGQKPGRPTQKVSKENRTPSYSTPKTSSQKSSNIGYLAVIAILAIGLAWAAYQAYSYSQIISVSKELIATRVEKEIQLNKVIEEQKKVTEGIQEQLAFYQNRENEIKVLEGTNRSPSSKLVLYWNNTAKSAAVDVIVLPRVSSNKVPVLWAVTSGSPVKIGVLSANAAGQRSSVTFVPNPRSFFVTEENSAEVTRPNRNRIMMRSLQ